MSLLGSSNIGVNIISLYENAQNQRRALGGNYRQRVPWTFTVDWYNFGYRSDWWPGGGGMLGEIGADVAMLHAPDNIFMMEPVSGAVSAYGITGVTRNAAGGILGGCTVKLFLTASDTLIYSTTSDPNTGQYLAITPYYPNAHYLVVYKVGPPDTFGTTPNTLIAG